VTEGPSTRYPRYIRAARTIESNWRYDINGKYDRMLRTRVVEPRTGTGAISEIDAVSLVIYASQRRLLIDKATQKLLMHLEVNTIFRLQHHEHQMGRRPFALLESLRAEVAGFKRTIENRHGQRPHDTLDQGRRNLKRSATYVKRSRRGYLLRYVSPTSAGRKLLSSSPA
jgi:hypothetical protein